MAVGAQGSPSRSQLLRYSDVYLDIFSKKKEEEEKRETLVADVEAKPATAVVAFVLLMHHYDAQILSRFYPSPLVLLPSAGFSFLLLSPAFSFVSPHFFFLFSFVFSP